MTRFPPGEPVAVIESMKMEYEVLAESGGEVLRVDVSVGELVRDGQRRFAGDRARVDGAAQAVRGRRRPVRRSTRCVARHAAGLDAARPDAVARRREQGRRTARENVADLVDEGTFVEYGPLLFAAQERRRSREELIARTPADGLVGGVGEIDGRPPSCCPTTTRSWRGRRACGTI